MPDKLFTFEMFTATEQEDLESELEELRNIVDKFAKSTAWVTWVGFMSDTPACEFCEYPLNEAGTEHEHTSDCIWLRAQRYSK